MAPPKDGYGPPRLSPLEEAFRTALRDYARQTAEEMLTSDPAVRGQIRSLITSAVEQMLDPERSLAITGRIRDAIVDGLTRDR